MSELEATARNVYLLQKSLEEIIAERDKLRQVCQPIYERIWDMPVNPDGTSDFSRDGLVDELFNICKVMKRYNRG